MSVYTFIKGQKKYLATNKLYYYLTPDYFGLSEFYTIDRVLYADNSVVRLYHYDNNNKTHSIITCKDWMSSPNYDIYALNFLNRQGVWGINYAASSGNTLRYYKIIDYTYNSSIGQMKYDIISIDISRDNISTNTFTVTSAVGKQIYPRYHTPFGCFRNNNIDYIVTTGGGGTDGNYMLTIDVTNQKVIQDIKLSDLIESNFQTVFSTNPYDTAINSDRGNIEGYLYRSVNGVKKYCSQYFTDKGINNNWQIPFEFNGNQSASNYSVMYDGYYSIFKFKDNLLIGNNSITDNTKSISNTGFGAANIYHKNNTSYILDAYLDENLLLNINKIDASTGNILNNINTNIPYNAKWNVCSPLYVINSHRSSMTYKTSKWCGIVNIHGICMIDVTKL